MQAIGCEEVNKEQRKKEEKTMKKGNIKLNKSLYSRKA